MQPDQDRLRKEIIDLAEYLSCTADELWNELKPIIAREVGLGRLDEQENTMTTSYKPNEYGQIYYVVRGDELITQEARIAELSKEDTPNE